MDEGRFWGEEELNTNVEGDAVVADWGERADWGESEKANGPFGGLVAELKLNGEVVPGGKTNGLGAGEAGDRGTPETGELGVDVTGGGVGGDDSSGSLMLE